MALMLTCKAAVEVLFEVVGVPRVARVARWFPHLLLLAQLLLLARRDAVFGGARVAERWECETAVVTGVRRRW